MGTSVAEEAELIGEEKDAMRAASRLNLLMQKYGDKNYGEKIARHVEGIEKAYYVPLSAIYEMRTGVWHRWRENPEFALEVAEKLWETRYRESLLLSIYLLEKVVRFKPAEVLEFVRKILPTVSNWEISDALATHGIGEIARTHPENILSLSEELIRRENKWERRFGVSILIPSLENGERLKEALKLVCVLMKDPDEEVRLAVCWLLRSASERYPKEVAAFIRLWIGKGDENTRKILLKSTRSLPVEIKGELEKLLKP